MVWRQISKFSTRGRRLIVAASTAATVMWLHTAVSRALILGDHGRFRWVTVKLRNDLSLGALGQIANLEYPDISYHFEVLLMAVRHWFDVARFVRHCAGPFRFDLLWSLNPVGAWAYSRRMQRMCVVDRPVFKSVLLLNFWRFRFIWDLKLLFDVKWRICAARIPKVQISCSHLCD